MSIKSKKNIAMLLLFIFSMFAVTISPFGANRRSRRKKKVKVKKVKQSVNIGLSLDKRRQRESNNRAEPNRHLFLECMVCHESVPDPKDENSPQIAPLKFKAVETLCLSCHEASQEVHPTNITPSENISQRILKEIFPLGKLGEEVGRLVCTTCHDIHRDVGTNNLLRGMALKKGDTKAVFSSQVEFCKSCHGEELMKLSPHYDNENENLCRFCHIISPDEVADDVYLSLTANISRTCNFCHDATQNSHFLKTNPFADEEIKDSMPETIPLIGGAYTCVSCHYSHESQGNPNLIRSDFIEFAARSKRITPHWSGIFCPSCHETKPEVGVPLNFKFDGDIVKVCNRCHDSPMARTFLHRVDHKPPTPEQPERYKFVHFNDKIFKLNEKGEMDCRTCHQRECEQTRESTGEHFLRGAPYEKVTDVCFKCHVEEVFKEINCHQGQLDDEGKPIIKQCLFCHSVDPTKKIEGIRQINFVAQIRLLCLRCHDEYDHPGTDIKTGRGINHLKPVVAKGDPSTHMKPLDQIPTDYLPLVRGNMMTCSTCHNSHEPGVLEGKRGAGAGEAQRRRMSMMKGELCIACHTF